MRMGFLVLLVFHALVHILWFGHANGWVELPYFTKDIPAKVGFSWLLAAVFFIGSAIQLGKRKSNWFHPALMGLLISQMWIFSAWEDTKLGSFVNLVVLIGILIGFFKSAFEGRFEEDVQAVLENQKLSGAFLREEDLKPLPGLIQNYIRRSGAIGKPRVENFYLEFEGKMRNQGRYWFPFSSRQYNFISRTARFFFMKARVKGISTHGYHFYQAPRAKMTIKALSAFPLLKSEVPELFPTETVTFLNDLCLFAPAALIDERIRWEKRDELSVRAVFTFRDLQVAAILFFNAEGDLVDFHSEDRYEMGKMKPFPFRTPVSDYREINGIRVPSVGEAIWEFPEGPFSYGRFHLKSIRYNLEEMPESQS